jgi:Macrocin-O-methyltransferase (TylF)
LRDPGFPRGTMESLIYHFGGDDARILLANSTRKNGAIHIDVEDIGMAIYGPYVPLQSGTYRAILKFLRDTSCEGEAIMDVCAGVGDRVLGTRILSANQLAADGEVSIEFSLTDPVTDLEVRVSSGGGFVGDIGSIRIVGEPNEVPRQFRFSDLPEVPIADSPSRGRNLYDGYRRGVGLQFGGALGKILGDSDFQEARDLCGRRTILGDGNLCNLFLIIKFYLPRLSPGHIVEFGSYRGGGAIFMAALARKFLPGCKVFGFDTFSGMPSTDQRVDYHGMGSFADVDLAELRSYVGKIGLQNNLEFIQGHFADTVAPMLRNLGLISLAHIDCDIRSAIACAYDAAKPYMVSGGYWILDDPMVSDCLGAAEAMEDLLIRRDGLNSEQVYPHYVFRQP